MEEISLKELQRFRALHETLARAHDFFQLAHPLGWFLKGLHRFMLTVQRDTVLAEEQFDWGDEAAAEQFFQELEPHHVTRDVFQEGLAKLADRCKHWLQAPTKPWMDLFVRRDMLTKRYLFGRVGQYGDPVLIMPSSWPEHHFIPLYNATALALLWGAQPSTLRLHHMCSPLFVENGFTFEGFADFFNKVLFEAACSLAPDLPRGFCSLSSSLDGSLGNFFEVDLEQSGEQGWVINPPFVESIMDRVADKILPLADRIPFLVIFPRWHDAQGHQKLTESEHFHSCEPAMKFTFEEDTVVSQGGKILQNIQVTVFQNKTYLSEHALSQ